MKYLREKVTEVSETTGHVHEAAVCLDPVEKVIIVKQKLPREVIMMSSKLAYCHNQAGRNWPNRQETNRVACANYLEMGFMGSKELK